MFCQPEFTKSKNSCLSTLLGKEELEEAKFGLKAGVAAQSPYFQ